MTSTREERKREGACKYVYVRGREGERERKEEEKTWKACTTYQTYTCDGESDEPAATIEPSGDQEQRSKFRSTPCYGEEYMEDMEIENAQTLKVNARNKLTNKNKTNDCSKSPTPEHHKTL